MSLRTTVQIAGATGIRATLVQALLEEERERGHVVHVDGGWALTASAEQKFGAALRAFPLFTERDGR